MCVRTYTYIRAYIRIYIRIYARIYIRIYRDLEYYRIFIKAYYELVVVFSVSRLLVWIYRRVRVVSLFYVFLEFFVNG